MDIKLFPNELLSDILLRLPAENLLRLKTVCKSWNELISDPMFVYAHLSYSMSKPDILFQTDDSHNIFSLDFGLHGKTMQRRKLHLPPIDEREKSHIPGYILKSYCNGLLLLRARTCDVLTIYNPITRIYKRLPRKQFRFQKESSSYNYSLIYDSSLGKYKVFEVDDYKNCSVFTQGGKDWKIVHNGCSQERQESTFISSTTILFVKNKLHFTIETYRSDGIDYFLHSLDVLKDELLKIDTPFTIQDSHQLSEVKGSLSFTNVFAQHLETWVLDDQDQSLWIRCSVIRFDPILSTCIDNLWTTCAFISFNPLLSSSPKFCNMAGFLEYRKLLVQCLNQLFIYDLEKKELSEIINSSGFLVGVKGFHINSLVNWI